MTARGRQGAGRASIRVAASAALFAAAGCGEENRLLGTWRLAGNGSCALDRIVFGPSNVTNRYGPSSPYAGREQSVPVDYYVDGAERVKVSSRDWSGSIVYVLLDADRMAFGNNPDCVFERAS